MGPHEQGTTGAQSWVVTGSMRESMAEYAFLGLWGALMWILIHFRRLDYLHEKSHWKRAWFEVFLGTTTGAAMYTGTAGFNVWYPGRLYVGLAIYFLYTAYNAKSSLLELHALTKANGNYPGFLRSTFFRRQMQMHVGMGFLGWLLAYLSTCPQVVALVQLNRVACIASLLGAGYQQLAMKPLGENESPSDYVAAKGDDTVVEMDDADSIYYSMT